MDTQALNSTNTDNTVQERDLWGIVFGLELKSPHRLKYVQLDSFPAPIELFKRLHSNYDIAFILESIEGPKRLAEYTFLGFEPSQHIIAADGNAELFDEEQRTLVREADPIRLLKEIQPSQEIAPSWARFCGGLIGYSSYELVQSLEPILNNRKSKKREFPDLEFGYFQDGIVYDHLRGRTFYFHHGDDRSREIVETSKLAISVDPVRFGKPTVNIKEEEFCNDVRKVKNYINSGDVFQTVISKRYKIPFAGSLLHVYEMLRRINPSPYMYHLKFGKREIVGASPEMLARKIGPQVESYPIAGTRPYTSDPNRNKTLARELLSDEKEIAEHVMLVDLARNDLGRISEYGTVHVPELMKIQSYSHVQHIVSRVTGTLRKGLTGFDLFRSVYPAGTVTGAPKIRAMQLIDNIEKHSRGPYAGAVGYFSNNGNADFAITIRTLASVDNTCYLQSGAGIVADSNPEKEWIETEQKAAAVFTAIDYAQGPGQR